MNETLIAIIGFIGGLAAGVINTLAGNGSAITLGILTDLMGIPGNIANGTNRIGIFAQAMASSHQMVSKNKDDVLRYKGVIITTVLGAIVGVFIATTVSNEQFTFVYKYIMFVMLFLVLLKPDKWLKEVHLSHSQKLSIWVYPLTFIVGVYGGFIQLGMGIFFLATLILIGNLGLKTSNTLKNVVVGIFTAIALSVFVYNDMVDWAAGIFIATGQALGGYLGGKYAMHSKSASKVAYWTLLIVIILVLIKQFIWSA